MKGERNGRAEKAMPKTTKIGRGGGEKICMCILKKKKKLTIN